MKSKFYYRRNFNIANLCSSNGLPCFVLRHLNFGSSFLLFFWTGIGIGDRELGSGSRIAGSQFPLFSRRAEKKRFFPTPVGPAPWKSHGFAGLRNMLFGHPRGVGCSGFRPQRLVMILKCAPDRMSMSDRTTTSDLRGRFWRQISGSQTDQKRE